MKKHSKIISYAMLITMLALIFSTSLQVALAQNGNIAPKLTVSVSHRSATITLTPSAPAATNGYTIRYKRATDDTWLTLTTSGSTATLTGLEVGEIYDIRAFPNLDTYGINAENTALMATSSFEVTPPTVKVSGTVSLSGILREASVRLMNGTTEVYRGTTQATTGTFEIGAVEAGTYTLVLSCPGFTSAYVTNLKVENIDKVIGETLHLYAGDINGDDIVDYEDYVLFLPSYGSVNPISNFTQNGVVNYEDYILFLTDYQKTAHVITQM